MNRDAATPIPRFTRQFFTSEEPATRIGEGRIGGKASGLVFVRDVLRAEFPDTDSVAEVSIPKFVVLASDVFEAFMQRNELWGLALTDAADDRIALAFQQGALPSEIVGDLRALVQEVHTPLAVRSSSLLEDALYRPFAGVYRTKMTPNNQHDTDARFRKLIEAIKLVWASTFFREAKAYVRATDESIEDERMAVIVQEVVGRRFDGRFYPELSAVARSYNFYRSGRARPEDGVIHLALGLGKTIVDGGITWPYCPRYPKAPPPFASAGDRLNNTQTRFWAVRMDRPPAFDPIAEAEYLVQCDLSTAEGDGALRHLASTYDPQSDRIVPGLRGAGARVLDFAPLLTRADTGFNEVASKLLAVCQRKLDAAVEIELAVTLPAREGDRPRFGFLQVRPMVVSEERVDIAEEELAAADLLLASEHVMGNGARNDVYDIVWVKPESFEARLTRRIATEIEALNRELLAQRRSYLLIGFGRWGSADPWLGIPVNWDQISGATVIIEASLETMNVEPSQGSHFFHNLSSFRVSYFTLPHHGRSKIDWSWLGGLPAESDTDLLRHARLDRPLRIKVDGRSGRGAIWHG